MSNPNTCQEELEWNLFWEIEAQFHRFLVFIKLDGEGAIFNRTPNFSVNDCFALNNQSIDAKIQLGDNFKPRKYVYATKKTIFIMWP